jgi:hypothetical protein
MLPGLETWHLLANLAVNGTIAAQGWFPNKNHSSSYFEGSKLEGRKFNTSPSTNWHPLFVIFNTPRALRLPP